MAHLIEKNDHMAFAGAKPWHGIGTAMTGNPTIETAIRASKLDWEVESVPVFRQHPIDTALIRVDSARAIVRADTGEELGSCGPQWKPLQNRKAFEWFQPFLDEGLAEIETCGSLENGRRVWVLAKITGPQLEVGKGDMIEKYILLSNAHTGKHALRVGFVPIRVVCWNTLSVAHSDSASKLLRIRHSTRAGTALVKLRETMDVIHREFNFTAETFRKLEFLGISRSDLIKYGKRVFQIDSRTNTRSFVPIMESILQRFDGGMGNHGRSWWDAYNAVTEHLSYVSARSLENRYGSLWFGANGKVNDSALAIALEMATAV